MGISILKFLSVHHCVLQSKICVLTYSVTTITIAECEIKTKNARITGRLDLQKDTGNEAEFLTQGHREGQLTAKKVQTYLSTAGLILAGTIFFGMFISKLKDDY